MQPIDRMYIDVGAAKREEAEGWGIQVGDPVVPHSEFLPLKNDRILSSKAFDDRGTYKPGETAHVKGWVRLVDQGERRPPQRRRPGPGCAAAPT